MKVAPAVPRGVRLYLDGSDISSPGLEHSRAQINKIAAAFSPFLSPSSAHMSSMKYLHVFCKGITALPASETENF